MMLSPAEKADLVRLAKLSGLRVDDLVLDTLIQLLDLGANPRDVKSLLSALLKNSTVPTANKAAPAGLASATARA